MKPERDEYRLTFKQKLKALPDVVTDPASKKSFLKRIGPSWEEEDTDEDHASDSWPLTT
ncbi:hypothetical protein M885DRAFT_559253 [Pelagophyceae sp. CCMP2097]|nr:hypothetical protein M885DRAFT_559253 [Pelagophyceae sp. CCMP2097]